LSLRTLVRRAVPLGVRVAVADWMGRNRWFPAANRWSEGLVRDLEVLDPKRFHKFKWAHHHGSYADTYEPELLFSARKLNGTERAYQAFVEDLRAALRPMDHAARLESVLDVGCSVGHVLHALETDVLGEASTLIGIDIDRHAIESGRAWLAGRSKIRLLCGDLEDLDGLVGAQSFDFSFAAGSLSYLTESDAAASVRTILSRTERVAAFVGLANPGRSNAELGGSVLRHRSMWAHDFGAMARDCGWTVARTRWEPPQGADSQGLYSVFVVRPIDER
jgi:SAM-dependent methyltransferase